MKPGAGGRAGLVFLRWLLGLLYLAAGALHLIMPDPFLRITPGWVPEPEAVIRLTGLAELLGAAALLQPWSMHLRKAGGIGLALYALFVWPANIHHMMLDMARPDHGWRMAYHIPRMLLQPVLIWLALRVGGVTRWPRRRSTSDQSPLPPTP
ncbi:DoxX family protein [Altericroceibacterium xinjiangense]|uniref:DoxX family protein n=1 Tax=Altericroceibacterium xinjiangense TaxID=762261 RepID=UPI000F7F8FBF|nr:DoxX family protein [Altericroceibacterium xinjiangense]